MDGGQLVPDDLMINVISERLKQKDCIERGWLLDGFPRTGAQAEALTAAGQIPDCFVLLDVPQEVLVERVTGRRTDPVTGKIYHTKFAPPEDKEIESRLVQRSDDTAEKVVIRYKEYQAHIKAVRSFYEEKIITIDGSKDKNDISNKVVTTLYKALSKIKKSPKIIIAGAPAAGKGTQCEIITQTFGVVHLSTGDILREAVKQGTDLGLKAKAYMDGGQLVPDDLMINVISERLKQKDCIERGWLLDGFPRTGAQAEALTAAGQIPDCFVLLDVPQEVLVERVTGRRTDPVTGKIYHTKFAPPEDKEIESRLVQRSDDTAEKVVIRYKEYQAHIKAVRSFYEEKIITIDGSKDKNDISDDVIHSLARVLTKRHIKKAPKLIIAGAPASGKGTHSEIIKKTFGVIHLSTGDILREAVRDGTELGLKARGFMDAGQLVPDDLIISAVCDRLRQKDCLEHGWLLDGFPRTGAQARALTEQGLTPDSFVLLDVPEELLVERVTGRRSDPVTGKIYHIKFSPPENDEIASRLIQRSDDTEEKVKIRYKEYLSHVDAVKSLYEDKIINIDGTVEKSVIWDNIINSLTAALSK